MKPNIFIADDHPLLLKGLKDLIEEKNYTVIGTATDGLSAYNFIIQNKPDIAILDVEMPKLTGIEIAKSCLKNNSLTKIILITLHKELDLYLQAKKLNIYGYLLKEFALDEIDNCLQSVTENKPYFSDEIKKLLSFDEESDTVLKDLTPIEKRVLKLIAKDKTNKEIGRLLFISHRTVEKHRAKAITKLNIESKTGALFKWVQKNKHLFQ
ncbi:MAG TPA: response regulator transcription factor [Flavobacteriaceae bacterium]|nr:response regulator transcription factor [Flavobacteriaceae bacterium]